MDGLWSFWYYEWVELEFPEDGYVYFHGNLKELSEFLKRKLGPGKAKGYICIEEDSAGGVLIRLKPEKLIQEMDKHLSRDIFQDHLLALGEAGWL